MACEEAKGLPGITNQKMNDDLKAMAELAGMDESVSQTQGCIAVSTEEVTYPYALLCHSPVEEQSSLVPENIK